MASSKIMTSMPSTEQVSIKPKKEKKEKKEKSGKKRKSEVLEEPVDLKAELDTEMADAPASPANSDKPSPAAEENSESRPSKKRKAVVEEIEVDITAPEPPSKKALRALKKGKPLPPSKSGADSSPEPEAKKEKPEVEKRSEHGIWIGNLPFFVSKDELRTFLVEKSDLTEEMITRIHMKGPNDKKSANKVETKKFGKTQHNTGFAYVDFSTAEAVEEAVELSEQLLGGRRVLIKNNKSFEGRPEKTKEETRMEGKPPSKRVFLGNLSFEATEDSIKEFFEKCGAIESVKLATFEDSGKCKGYGWIVFEELEAAQSAVRGFVMVEEELSDSESESESESDSGSDSEEEKVVIKTKPKKLKKRKVWVNRIKGRPLRMEFAEDAQVRYKKRYGKDGTKRSGDRVAGEDAGGDEPKPKAFVPKKVEYRESYAPRLTGGIVESKGKKVTF